MQSMAGESSSAMAVDGFVPKHKPKKPALRQTKSPNTTLPSRAANSASQHSQPSAASSSASQHSQVHDAFQNLKHQEAQVTEVDEVAQQTGPNVQQRAQQQAMSNAASNGYSAHVAASMPGGEVTMLSDASSQPDLVGTLHQAATSGHPSAQPSSRHTGHAAPSGNGGTAAHDSSQQGPVGQTAGSCPVISFEVQDAESPLEGAEHGINANFGRLKASFSFLTFPAVVHGSSKVDNGCGQCSTKCCTYLPCDNVAMVVLHQNLLLLSFVTIQ